MPMHLGLSDSALYTNHIPLQSLVATAVNGTAVDMQGWEGVAFVIPHGIFGTNGTLNGLVQTAPDSGFNTVTNVANSSLTQITNANGVAIVEVWRPSARYVRLQLTGQTNGVTSGAVAVQYRRNGILPPTQAAAQIVKVAQN